MAEAKKTVAELLSNVAIREPKKGKKENGPQHFLNFSQTNSEERILSAVYLESKAVAGSTLKDTALAITLQGFETLGLLPQGYAQKRYGPVLKALKDNAAKISEAAAERVG